MGVVPAAEERVEHLDGALGQRGRGGDGRLLRCHDLVQTVRVVGERQDERDEAAHDIPLGGREHIGSSRIPDRDARHVAREEEDAARWDAGKGGAVVERDAQIVADVDLAVAVGVAEAVEIIDPLRNEDRCNLATEVDRAGRGGEDLRDPRGEPANPDEDIRGHDARRKDEQSFGGLAELGSDG